MLLLLRFAKYVPVLFALITSTVQLVESVKAHLPGEEKKKAVLDALADLWPGLMAQFGFSTPWAVLVPVASLLVDLAVGIYNVVGYFSHKDPAATGGVSPTAAVPAQDPGDLTAGESAG